MIQTFTSADTNQSSTSFTRTVGGHTIIYSADPTNGLLGIDNISYGSDGLEAYDGTLNSPSTKLVVTIEAGYTFDINSIRVGTSSGSLNVSLTYGNGLTNSFDVNGLSNSWQTLSNFARPIDNVKQVVFTSNDFGLFQDFDVTDVKAIANPPTVSDINIFLTSSGSGTSGTYKIGDTITARWDSSASGDNNANLTGVTFDFSQFGGGSAVYATNSAGVWTASYTMNAGSIDATGRNVSVSATSLDGTTTTVDSTNIVVDNIAPTVTDARISISGASGTGGAYRIGDTVTATWNNTAGGDNNTDTIGGVRFDFSQFGGGSAVAATNSGGTWTATYTIVSGSISAANRNVAVLVTDNAGNVTTRADSTNATVDNTSPTITIGNLSLSADTGTSSVDFVTRISAQTISATLSGALTGGDVLYGSLNNGATWADITSTVSGTSLTWTGVTLSGSNTLSFKVVDGAGNQSSPTSQAYTLDTIAPNAPSVSSLTAASDTGASRTDGITSVATPSVKGLAEANSIVTLYDTDGTTSLGSVTADGSGNWTITSPMLNPGLHILSAKSTDVAGNTSVASAGFAVTVDRTGPTGISLSTTSVLQASATTGATIATLSSTDLTSVAYDFVVGNGTIDADNGKFSISGTSLVAAQNLTAGAYHIYLSGTDAAGNASYQIFTVNVSDPPSVTSIVRTGGQTAAVAAAATSISYTVTFSQSVTGVTTDDFSLTSTGSAAGTIANVSGSGTTYTVTVNNLSGDGPLRLDLNITGTGILNGSGNPIIGGYSAGQTYTLDHTPPLAPVVGPMLVSASDSGTLGDGITTVTTPTLTGTSVANALVKLYDTNGATLLGTATADGIGHWNITSDILSEGSHALTVKVSDTAGNISSASPATTVIVDTTNPVLAFAPGSSVVYSAGQTVYGTVLDANATGTTVTLKEGSATLGTGVVQADGTWSASVNLGSLGAHTITASVTDLAGNTGEANTRLILADPPSGLSAVSTFTVSLALGQTQTFSGLTTGSFVFGGLGTVKLFGANTYTGPTTVNGGTLVVDGSIVSPISVKLGGTLGGHGTTGTVTVESGGTLSPGNSPGVLTTLDLTLAAGATLKEELGGTGQGQFDQTKVIGTVALNGATLNLASYGSFVSARGNKFTIIDNDGTDAVQGTFAGLSDDASLTLGARAYQISYRGGDGNDVVLTDVTMPDAATLALFGKVETNPASQTGGIYALYQGLLGRTPDALGLQGFSASLQAGAAITDVAAAMLDSAERGGIVTDPTAYVKSLYTNALHRSADSDGLNFYVNELKAGVSQATVAVQIATSAEAQGVHAPAFANGVFVSDALSSAVARLYYGVLGRAPDAGGLQGFEAQVKQGAAVGGVDGAVKGLAGVVSTMLGSQEYTSTHADQTSASFVDSLYFGALGRHADAGGLAFYTNELAQGVSQAQVALQIAQSAEAQVHLVNQIELGWHLV